VRQERRRRFRGPAARLRDLVPHLVPGTRIAVLRLIMNAILNAVVSRHALALVPTCFVLANIFACSATVNADVSGEPTVTGCTQDETVQGCTSGSFGYSCDNGDTPDQSDSSLQCSYGVADPNGNTDYCCVSFASSATCAQDPTVTGCSGASFGFSCTGSDTPSDDDSSLTCSSGVAGNAGSLLYCCEE
jgi:hypothetical protein